MATKKSSGPLSASQQPPAGRQESVGAASTQPAPIGPMLYEHRDGRYAIAPRPELASFAAGDPDWTRLGRVSIVAPDVEPAPGDRDSDIKSLLAGMNRAIGQTIEDRDAVLSDAMQALVEAEALFTAIRDSIGTGRGGDPISLAEVGRRLTYDAYARGDPGDELRN